MTRIKLDYGDFEKLTNGEVVEKGDVQIALDDIGWFNMIDIIKMNLNKKTDYEKI